MMGEVRETRLPNGVRVVTSAMPNVASLSLGVWVGVGSRLENKHTSGISHFIEHLLFKGTKKRSARDISREIEGRGGYLNAFTQEEDTCYYARVASDHLVPAVNVLADMYIDPLFDPEEIDRERGCIIEEILMYRDQPQQMVQEHLTESLWSGHPLGRSVAGTPETLAGIGRRELLNFKKRGYLPGNTLFAFAGKLDHDECVKLVLDVVGKLKGGRRPTWEPANAKVAQKAMTLEKKDVEQTHLALGVRLFGRHDRRKYALKILNVILGENMSSRLFYIIREKHGMAYSIQSSVSLLEDTGALMIGTGLDSKRCMKALDLIVRELKRLREKDVENRELAQAKEYVIGQLKLGLESTTNQMMWIGENIMSFGRIIAPEEVIGEFSHVTARDVRDLACSVLRADRTSISTISPEIGPEHGRRIESAIAGM